MFLTNFFRTAGTNDKIEILSSEFKKATQINLFNY